MKQKKKKKKEQKTKTKANSEQGSRNVTLDSQEGRKGERGGKRGKVKSIFLLYIHTYIFKKLYN